MYMLLFVVFDAVGESHGQGDKWEAFVCAIMYIGGISLNPTPHGKEHAPPLVATAVSVHPCSSLDRVRVVGDQKSV